MGEDNRRNGRSRARRFGPVLIVMALLGLLVSGATPADAHGRHHYKPRVAGMVIVESNRSFEETWSTLITALETNPNINLVATIDHGAAAASVGLELDPNRVAVFGNPALGSPLMQQNQVTGIDLPQKIQVFTQRDRVWVGFNDATYLEARHRLSDQPTLVTIAGALRALGGGAADREIPARPAYARPFRYRPGLITVASDADIDTTWERLLAAIDASPASIAFTVDHQAGAERAGLELRPTRLVAFGNPNLGTPLMQERATAGIDLPIKFLVWEDAQGTTQVTTNDTTLARRHRIRRTDLGAITGAVENFLAVATTTPS